MIPELKLKTGSFARPTDTGDQTITGVGFQPKAILIYGGNMAAEGDTAEVRFSAGCYAANRSAQIASCYSLSTVPYAGTASMPGGVYFHMLSSGSLTQVASASISAVTDDGFVINWVVVDANSPQVFYIALGGEALIDCNVGSFTAPTTTGIKDTIVGFNPDFVMLFGVNPTIVGSEQEMSFCSGWGSGMTGQCIAGSADQTTTPTNTMRHLRAALALMMHNTNTNAIKRRATYSSFYANGFRLNHTTVSANEDTIVWFAFKGIQAYTGAATAPQIIGLQTSNWIGFRPQLLMTQNDSNAAAPEVQNHLRMGRGFADGTNHRHFFAGSTDNQNPPINREDYSESKVVRMLTETGSGVTLRAQSTLSEFNAAGFVLNWDTVETTVLSFEYCAIGPKPVRLGHLHPTMLGHHHVAGRLWTFDNDEDGWTTSGVWGAAYGHDGGGIYKAGVGSKKKVASLTCSWSGTFEDLGVPAGATVEYAIAGESGVATTGVDLVGVGITSKTLLSYEIQDDSGNLLQQMLGGETIGDYWLRFAGPDEGSYPLPSPPLLLDSDTPIIIYLGAEARGVFGSSVSVDNIGVVVKYRWSKKWEYQRTDSDTLWHYKFVEADSPIIDHSSYGNNAVDLYPGQTPPVYLYQQPAPAKLSYSMVMNRKGASLMGASPLTSDILIGASDSFTGVSVIKLPALDGTAQALLSTMADSSETYWGVASQQTVAPPNLYADLVVAAYGDNKKAMFVRFPGAMTTHFSTSKDTQIAHVWERGKLLPKVWINGVELTGGFNDASMLYPPYTAAADINDLGALSFTVAGGGINIIDYSGYLQYEPISYYEFWASKGTTFTSKFL